MTKLLQIQTELKCPKGNYNKFSEYNYRNCEDILEAVKPLLLKHGCTLRMSDDILHLGDRFYVKATAYFYEDGKDPIVSHAYAREELDRKKFDVSQLTGAASSYARKYALQGLFLIDDGHDADAVDNTGQPAKKVKGANVVQPIPEARLDKMLADCKTKDDVARLYKSEAVVATISPLEGEEQAHYVAKFKTRINELTPKETTNVE